MAKIKIQNEIHKTLGLGVNIHIPHRQEMKAGGEPF